MFSIQFQAMFWIGVFALVYIYAGYPLIAWWRSRGRMGIQSVVPAQISKASSPTTVSIVIVAHNEAHSLPAKLRSLLSSNVADRIQEILIGSDGSTDATLSALAQFDDARIKLMDFPVRRGKPSVLNDVVPQAQAEIVLLADARQTFDPDCVGRLLSRFDDPTVGVVSGELVLRSNSDRTAAAEGIGFYWQYEKFIRRCETGGRGVPGATGACYAIRKSLFRPIPAETILDDVVIPMQAVEQGFRCLFEPGAVAFDEPSKSPRQESIRKRRTIAGAAQLIRLFPRWLLPWRNPLWFEYVSHKLLRLLSPLLMGIVLIANLNLLEIGAYRVLLVWQTAFYAAAMIGLGFQMAGRASSLFGPFLMFITLNLTTALALWDALCSKYCVTWQKTA